MGSKEMNEREAVEGKAENPLVFKQGQGFWKNYRSGIVLALMVIWVLLLILGTIAEVFDIQKILSWPIWRPPGAMH